VLSGELPFYSINPSKIFERARENEMQMKPFFSDSVQSLLNGLLCINVLLLLIIICCLA